MIELLIFFAVIWILVTSETARVAFVIGCGILGIGCLAIGVVMAAAVVIHYDAWPETAGAVVLGILIFFAIRENYRERMARDEHDRLTSRWDKQY